MLESALVVACGTVALTIPLALAAMGGYLSERSGVMNIALEGKMLASACAAALAGSASGSPGVALLAACACGIVIGLIHWTMTQWYRIDHVVSGMALNAIAYGGTNYLVGTAGQPGGFLSRPMPPLPHVPVMLGAASLELDVPLLIAVLAPICIAVVAARTQFGLRLRAVGSDPDRGREIGLNPPLVRIYALIWAGALCGVAGVAIVGATGTFTDNMTAGSGYIALAALIVGGWRPVPAALATLAFGFFKALQIELQGTHVFGANLPSQAWQALPYLVAVVALAGVRSGARAPIGLGKP